MESDCFDWSTLKFIIRINVIIDFLGSILNLFSNKSSAKVGLLYKSKILEQTFFNVEISKLFKFLTSLNALIDIPLVTLSL